MFGDLIYLTQVVLEFTNYPENFVAGTSAALHVALLGIMMVSDIASVIRLRHGRVPCQIVQVGSRHNFIQEMGWFTNLIYLYYHSGNLDQIHS